MNSYLIIGGANQERLEKTKALIGKDFYKPTPGLEKLTNSPDLLIIKPELGNIYPV